MIVKVIVKYNKRGEARFKEHSLLDENLLKRTNQAPNTSGSGLLGLRSILSGFDKDFIEEDKVGKTVFTLELSSAKKIALVLVLRPFKRLFKADDDFGRLVIK